MQDEFNLESIVLNKKDLSEKKFYFSNDSGKGKSVLFNTFPGVKVVFNEMDLEYYIFSSEGDIPGDIIEINQCLFGRFECNYGNKKFAYMTEGDVSISKTNSYQQNRVSYFPAGKYQGITIFLELQEIKKSNETERLFKEFGISIEKILNHLKNDQFKIIRSDANLSHIFQEFYNTKIPFKENYLRIKVIELFLFLVNDCFIEKEKIYLSKSDVDKVKSVKELIEKDLQHHFTIEELSELVGMSSTNLKKYFKEVFGTGIYEFYMISRFGKAMEQLKTTEKSITEIANEVGYSNPAKFSSAFRKKYGIKPSDVRKKYPIGLFYD